MTTLKAILLPDPNNSVVAKHVEILKALGARVIELTIEVNDYQRDEPPRYRYLSEWEAP